MSTLDFTRIKWAGLTCILITDRERSQLPIILLTAQDVKRLNDEMRGKR